MPKKIELSEIIKQLPAFVRIMPESYRGIRYKAKFIDLEYNEEFEAIPGAVIKLQHGCKSRANQRRADSEGYTGPIKTDLNEILAQLPAHIEMDVSTYKGKRHKATFRDKELNITFEMLVCNLLRNGKGYCKERQAIEFIKSVSVPIEEIEERLFKIYGNKLTLDKSSYINGTNGTANFINNEKGTTFIGNVNHVLSGRYIVRSELDKWKRAIKSRDNFTCQVCTSKDKIVSHHIFSWVGFEDKSLNLNNGITLCQTCHNEFHSLYGKGDNTLSQFTDYLNKKGERLSTLAREIESRFNSVPPSL